jgi:hypothetical protein
MDSRRRTARGTAEECSSVQIRRIWRLLYSDSRFESQEATPDDRLGSRCARPEWAMEAYGVI